MDVSSTPVIERIARVLVARNASANASGDDPSAGPIVDELWADYREDALAVLRTLREPDEVMARAGDPVVWAAMIQAALGEA
jgi:hypothetical protein